ncbi:MAG: hypothetical protein IJE62_01860 [Clostridia bacterium]|nr:hypothetical protein [Clostridia bacterium]
MDEFFSSRLYKVAIKKELERQKINPDDLAERHAIKMLDEITKIVDTHFPRI